MKIIKTSIPDVLIIEPKVFSDNRGFFLEAYQKEKYYDAGIKEEFIQVNHSGSNQYVLRGIHYQIKHPQGKLVRVVKGEVYDVAVDLRRSSPTFGKYFGTTLSDKTHRQLWVPPGFGHGFLVLSEWAEFVYMTTDKYAPEWDRTIIWTDPDLGIDWPVEDHRNIFVSEKDARGSTFRTAEVFD